MLYYRPMLYTFMQLYKNRNDRKRQVAFEIEKFFNQNGAEGVAFETIVASGKNSSKPHAVPTDKKIEAGDAITIDMGCKYKGYCSDMTRTIFAGYVPVQDQEKYTTWF